MIADKYSENDFFLFGSGILLQDLMTFLAPQNKQRKDKIIFIGDPAQLPTVSDSITGALSAEYLYEKYSLVSKEYELTQVVRQSGESGILRVATHIRNRLLNLDKFTVLEIDNSYPEINPNQYRKMKTALPYLLCGHFHPKIRRKENFVFTERFLIDIDHLSEYELNIQQTRDLLKQDERVELLFASPGGDGLKVLFRLKDRITDSGYYGMFYKSFCIKLAALYRLGAAVDIKTNDVSRCCFVSFDTEAYYNPSPQLIDSGQYVIPDDFQHLDILKGEIKEAEKAQREQKQTTYIGVSDGQELSTEVLNAIKIKVGQRLVPPKEKHYEQPERLAEIIAAIDGLFSDVGARLISNDPIHYGRQIKAQAGHLWTEINVFYGKKGVSIIPTTKTGSNKELSKLLTDLLKSQLA
ncbi:MAG: CRISPR-associated primase-polymerase type B [Saprospiraceae bacterium]|nr:CRISPR-associated primase-polymerase type B [Saprospiraceae bacterium]